MAEATQKQWMADLVIDCTDEEEQDRWYKKLKRSKAKCRRVTG